MKLPERYDIPLLERLIPGGVKAGTQFLVEYDPESQWYAVAATICCRWIQHGHRSLYFASARPRDEVIEHLTNLGLDVAKSEGDGILRVDDAFSASLGLEQKDTMALATEVVDDRYLRYSSLKISDLSVQMLKQLRGAKLLMTKWGESQLGVLSIAESFSTLLRFNEEKAFLEWMESRDMPLQRRLQRTNLHGFLTRLHSESFYTRLESACDGLVDIRVVEKDGVAKDVLRVRSLKGRPHDRQWHKIEIKPNGEAALSD